MAVYNEMRHDWNKNVQMLLLHYLIYIDEFTFSS